MTQKQGGAGVMIAGAVPAELARATRALAMETGIPLARLIANGLTLELRRMRRLSRRLVVDDLEVVDTDEGRF